MALRSFSDVDRSEDRTALLAALDEQADLPAIQRLRAKGIELLAPQAGDRLLDAGCGTGDVTRALARAVGPTGRVVGVDASLAMLDEARRRTRASDLAVELRHGDITHLELGDGELDGVYCERVFQHLDDPHAAMAELVRITRPGGRVVVIDTDWGMHAIHGPDPAVTSRVIRGWADQATNGFAGRQLPALFAECGLIEATVVADTITSRDPRPPSLEPFRTMAAVAQAHGALTVDEEAGWLTDLDQAAGHGRFFWAVTLVLVSATRAAAR